MTDEISREAVVMRFPRISQSDWPLYSLSHDDIDTGHIAIVQMQIFISMEMGDFHTKVLEIPDESRTLGSGHSANRVPYCSFSAD